MMYKKLFLTSILLITIDVFAQSGLKIVPESIRFKDKFNRLENVYLINEGNKPLYIDSIYYKRDIYYMRFDRPWVYPLQINPGDSVLMDCILSKPYLVTRNDTKDTMFIYLEEYESEQVKIDVDFFYDDIHYGNISGKVTSSTPINNAAVYFYYDGKYLFDSVHTNPAGDYSISLPEGLYTVSASMENHYLSFINEQKYPLNPSYINLIRYAEEKADLNLNVSALPGRSISGRAFDNNSKGLLKRAIIVVRKGTHNSSKINQTSASTDEVYSTLVNEDGSYKINIPNSGYYYIQGFSDYYLPGYYGSSNTPIFWQEADSIFIDTDISQKDLFFTRDSSFGAGIITGQVYIPSQPDSAIKDVVILVKSLDSDVYISYGAPESDGNFRISNLPYGNYQLIAQKIGVKDATSIHIEIDSTHIERKGVQISLVTSISERNILPEKIILEQNFPNPFNSSTKIRYSIPDNKTNTLIPVQLSVYNSLGERIAILINKEHSPGNYEIAFDEDNIIGGLTGGVYFYELRAGNFITSNKMVYLK